MATAASSMLTSGSGVSFGVRMLLGLVFGVFVTLVLFWAMQYLIATADRTLDEARKGHLLDFVRVKREETIERRKLKPEKPPPPEAPPPEPPTPKLDDLTPSAEKIAISAVPVETEVDLTGGFSLGVGEGDYLPIVKVAPIYPQRALSRGIEGYCTVEYTVTKQGTTKGVRVLEDQCTSSLFFKASVDAAGKFKYKPRIIDGEAIEVPGVRNKFTYVLEE
jgi:protein TonB